MVLWCWLCVLLTKEPCVVLCASSPASSGNTNKVGCSDTRNTGGNCKTSCLLSHWVGGSINDTLRGLSQTTVLLFVSSWRVNRLKMDVPTELEEETA